jgi:GntR family transcriptional regulator, gluconate operon transcriptional repressor
MCSMSKSKLSPAARAVGRSVDAGAGLSLAPLGSHKLADQAAEALRALIASGALRGGQRLVEAVIADQLNVSRGPVRDAFRQLRGEGLLREVPRRGTYVVSLTMEDVRDLMDLRAALETRAARLITERGRAADLEALEAALTSLEVSCHIGDAATIGAADFVFHAALCRTSGSNRLYSVFVRYETELRVLLRSDEERHKGAGVDIWKEHEQLLNALRTGDPATAEDTLRAHVEEARDRLVVELTSETDGSALGVPVPAPARQEGTRRARALTETLRA